MGFICRILKHGRWAISKEKNMGMNNPLYFLNDDNGGRDVQENTMFLSAQKILWPKNLTWITSEMFLWSIGREQLVRWAPPQILMPKCTNHNKLVTFAFGVCKLGVNYPILQPHRCKKNPQKQDSIQNLDWTVDVSTTDFLNEHWKVFHFHQNKHHWCSCKVRHWSGVNALTWSPNTTKNMTPLPDLTFFPTF